MFALRYHTCTAVYSLLAYMVGTLPRLTAGMQRLISEGTTASEAQRTPCGMRAGTGDILSWRPCWPACHNQNEAALWLSLLLVGHQGRTGPVEQNSKGGRGTSAPANPGFTHAESLCGHVSARTHRCLPESGRPHDTPHRPPCWAD